MNLHPKTQRVGFPGLASPLLTQSKRRWLWLCLCKATESAACKAPVLMSASCLEMCLVLQPLLDPGAGRVAGVALAGEGPGLVGIFSPLLIQVTLSCLARREAMAALQRGLYTQLCLFSGAIPLSTGAKEFVLRFSRAGGAPQKLSSPKRRGWDFLGWHKHAQGRAIPAPMCPWHLDVLLLAMEGVGKPDCPRNGGSTRSAKRCGAAGSTGLSLALQKGCGRSAVLGYW